MAVRALAAVLVALLAAAATACGDGGSGGGTGGSGDALPERGCGADRQERIDPASANHVLRGAAEPEYLTDPPTSGPHVAAPARDGVLPDPLGRPEQVGHLEAGGILLQHGELAARDQDALESLAGTGVVVVPNPELPAPVVATAWTRKLLCATVDVDALRAFVDAHLGQGPGSD